MRLITKLQMGLVLLLAIATCVPARGETVTLEGDGLDSCVTWSQARSQGWANTREAWVLGYLSAVAKWGDGLDPLKATSPKDVLEWIDAFCASRPRDTIEQGAALLIHLQPHGRDAK
jgi:hypothetical protein